MRYIYQSIHNHAGRWIQSECSERKTQEICGIPEHGNRMEIVNEYSDDCILTEHLKRHILRAVIVL